MKSILKHALVGVLLITGTTKPAAATTATAQDQVKTALLPIIPNNGIINNTIIKECVGTINWGNPAWLCSEINSTLQKSSVSTLTSYTSLNGFLPYMGTISADVETNTVKKIVIINDSTGGIICGIIFTKTTDTCTAAYKTKTETEGILKLGNIQSMFGFANRGVTSFYNVPTEYRGPIYKAAKFVGYLTAAGLTLYACKKLFNWYTDPTPFLEKIAEQESKIQALKTQVSALIARNATAAATPAAAKVVFGTK